MKKNILKRRLHPLSIITLSRSAIWHRVNTLRKGKRASPWLLAKNVINEYSGALTKVCGQSNYT